MKQVNFYGEILKVTGLMASSLAIYSCANPSLSIHQRFNKEKFSGEEIIPIVKQKVAEKYGEEEERKDLDDVWNFFFQASENFKTEKDIDDFLQQIESLDDLISYAKKILEDNKLIARLDALNQEKEEAIKELLANLENVEERYDGVVTVLEEKRENIARLKTEKEEKQKEAEDRYKTEYERLDSLKEEISQRINSLQQEINAQKEQLCQIQKTRKKIDAEKKALLADLTQRIKDEQEVIKKIEQDRNTLNKDKKVLQGRIRALGGKIPKKSKA